MLKLEDSLKTASKSSIPWWRDWDPEKEMSGTRCPWKWVSQPGHETRAPDSHIVVLSSTTPLTSSCGRTELDIKPFKAIYLISLVCWRQSCLKTEAGLENTSENSFSRLLKLLCQKMIGIEHRKDNFVHSPLSKRNGDHYLGSSRKVYFTFIFKRPFVF